MSDQPPFQTRDVDLTDEVYDALVPLDGFPKGTRGGPRIYRYYRWWVSVATSDFGDVLVGPWGDYKPLDEAEMVEAIRNAPCLQAAFDECGRNRHPECAARAVIDLINGEKEKPTTKPTWAEAWEELGPLVLPTPIYPDPEVKP